MKNILVATDISERSDRAVQRALKLAAASGAECHALFVADDSLPGDIAEPMRAEVEARLRRILDAAPVGEAARAIALVGDPVAAICDHAAAIGADLVVLGLHRPRPFLDALRETTMERLVRLLPQPVLLVRDPADHDYRKVLVPVSLSPACASALRAARAVAPDAKLHAFHAIHVPYGGLTGESKDGAMARAMRREAEAARAEWSAAGALPKDMAEVDLISGSLRQILERKLQATGADLVALGAHTRNLYLASGLGTFTAEMIRNPPTDLLIARPRRALPTG